MKPIRFYRITAVFMSILFLLAGCQKSAAEQLKEQLELGQNYLLEMKGRSGRSGAAIFEGWTVFGEADSACRPSDAGCVTACGGIGAGIDRR